MNAAKNYRSSTLFRQAAHGVAAQRVTGVNADADHVARLDFHGIQGIQCLVPNQGVAKVGGGGRREHIQPPRGDHSRSKRCITWIHQMNFHVSGHVTPGFEYPYTPILVTLVHVSVPGTDCGRITGNLEVMAFGTRSPRRKQYNTLLSGYQQPCNGAILATTE